MNASEMWKEYQKQDPPVTKYQAWAFCDGGEVGDRLANLVLEGKKTATASALIGYQAENDPLPQVGDYSVVLYDNNQAACVIQTLKVSLVPFNEVSKEHAYKEGEGDRTLDYWRKVHKIAFTPDYDAAGKNFDEKGIIVLEEFKVVFR